MSNTKEEHIRHRHIKTKEYKADDLILDMPDFHKEFPFDDCLKMFDDVYANIDFSVSYDSTEYLCLDSHHDNPLLKPESRDLIRRLKNYINYNLCYGRPEVYVQFLPKTSYMRAHLDNGRNAVVNVPLVPLNYDIIYHEIIPNTMVNLPTPEQVENEYHNLDLGEVYHEHTYTGPCIINGRIPHKVCDYGLDRKLLQISLPFKTDTFDPGSQEGEFWPQLKKAHESNELYDNALNHQVAFEKEVVIDPNFKGETYDADYFYKHIWQRKLDGEEPWFEDYATIVFKTTTTATEPSYTILEFFPKTEQLSPGQKIYRKLSLCLEKAVRYIENNTGPDTVVTLQTMINNSGRKNYYPYILLEIKNDD
jgi:hypothetical protein